MTYSHRIAMICSLLMLSACAETPINEGIEPNGLLTAYNGKADGPAYSIKDYFKNTANLDLSDLLEQAVNVGTGDLNGLLSSIPYLDIQLQPTKIFTDTGGEVLGLSTSSLDALVNNLSTTYGSDAVTTEINQVRLSHLATSVDTLYSESEFRVAVGGNFSFSTTLGDGDGTVGFLPSSNVTARLVTAHGDDELNALPTQPLTVTYDKRGFVLPTSVNEIAQMTSGESVTLLGRGRLGFNVGANLPVYSFDPINHLMLTARFHLGGRILTEGELDIHLVRAAGNEVIVEVGISDIRSRGIRAGLSSGFGLTNIPPLLEVDIGGKSWTLGALAERLIQRRLDKSGLLSYGAQALSDNSKSRVTLERFRLDLSQRSERLDRALIQAITGDLRLMQALADRQEGVIQEVSFDRNLNENHRYKGAHLASMRFFSESNTIEGSVRIEDENGAQTILFEDLQETRGRFFADWGFRRLIMTSSQWQGSQYLGSKANLRLAVTESDSYTARDQILDHVDAALLAVLDFPTSYSHLTRMYEELQQQVDLHCRRCNDSGDASCHREYRECMEMTLSQEEIDLWRADLDRATGQAIMELNPNDADPALANARHIADGLLNLKLQLSSIKEVSAALRDVAGDTQILSDVRFGQNGLDNLFRNVNRDDFEERLRQVLVVVVSKRSRDYDQKFDRALDWVDDEAGKIRDIVDIYDSARTRYIALDDQSRINVVGQSVGNGAYLIETLSQEDSSPVIRSIAESKAKIIADMVDHMVDRGRELSLIQSLISVFSLGLIDPRGFESHHLISYTLTTLVEPESREWLLSMNFEEEILPDLQLFSRGSDQDGFIQAGQFGLNFLLEGDL